MDRDSDQSYGGPSQLLLGLGGMSFLSGLLNLEKVNTSAKTIFGVELNHFFSLFLVLAMIYAGAQSLYGLAKQFFEEYYSCCIRIASEDQLFGALLEYLESERTFATKEELEEHVERRRLNAAGKKSTDAQDPAVKGSSDLSSKGSITTEDSNISGPADSQQKMAWYARAISGSRNFDANIDNFNHFYYYSDSEGEDSENDEDTPEHNQDKNKKKIKYSPTPGYSHFLYYKPTNSTISIARVEENQNGIAWHRRPRETVYLRVYGWDTTPIKLLLNDVVVRSNSRDVGKTAIYRASQGAGGPYWERCFSRAVRSMDSIILDQASKEEITADIEEYLMPATVKWYANRGLPYRRGYLLYGPPGTGKSSLTMALAGKFNLKIYSLSLSNSWMSDDNLATMFGTLPRSCVVLLEDVDACGITKNRGSSNAVPPNTNGTNSNGTSTGAIPEASSSTSSKTSVTFSGLLNAIDGVASKEGRVLIMTTNHRELLDEALIRPGRVDLQIKFSNLDKQGVYDLFKKLYDIEAADREALRFPIDFPDEETLEKLAKQFSETVPKDTFSPAKLQGYLLKWKKDPRKAVEEVRRWVEAEEAKAAKGETAEEKERKKTNTENTDAAATKIEEGRNPNLRTETKDICTPPTPPPERD